MYKQPRVARMSRDPAPDRVQGLQVQYMYIVLSMLYSASGLRYELSAGGL